MHGLLGILFMTAVSFTCDTSFAAFREGTETCVDGIEPLRPYSQLMVAFFLAAGPPSPPQGPLDVIDIYADRCALLWDKPKEDGGAPITHYVVEKCDQEKGEWEKVCDTDDLEIDVSDLTPGHKYQFRVSAVNSEGQSEFLSTDGAILAKDPWGRNHVRYVRCIFTFIYFMPFSCISFYLYFLFH